MSTRILSVSGASSLMRSLYKDTIRGAMCSLNAVLLQWLATQLHTSRSAHLLSVIRARKKRKSKVFKLHNHAKWHKFQSPRSYFSVFCVSVYYFEIEMAHSLQTCIKHGIYCKYILFDISSQISFFSIQSY